MICEICLEHQAIGRFLVTDHTIDVCEELYLCQRCIKEMKEYDVEITKIEKEKAN